MKPEAFRLLLLLGSRSRNDVFDCLNTGLTHPDDMAKSLGISRQAVDKVLREFYDMALLERSAIFPPDSRPKIIYTLSRPCRDLVKGTEALCGAFYEELRTQYATKLAELDSHLADGRLSEQAYGIRRKELDQYYKIIFEVGKDKNII